jgi:hypothetical protein
MGSFLNYFRAATQMAQSIIPFLVPLLAFIPGLKLPAAAITILGSIPGLCATAEELIGAGNGEAKKALVTSMVTSAVNTMKQVSTGGQAETWERVSQLVSPAIEMAVNNAKILAAAQTPVSVADRPTGA